MRHDEEPAPKASLCTWYRRGLHPVRCCVEAEAAGGVPTLRSWKTALLLLKAMELSGLPDHPSKNSKLEQQLGCCCKVLVSNGFIQRLPTPRYATDGDIAARWLLGINQQALLSAQTPVVLLGLCGEAGRIPSETQRRFWPYLLVRLAAFQLTLGRNLKRVATVLHIAGSVR